MRVRLLLLGCIFALLAGVGAPSAFASVIDYDTLTSGQKAAMKSRILTWDSLAGDTLEKGMWRAASAAGAEPTVSSLVTAGARFSVAATAGYIAYKIARPTIGEYVYRKITIPGGSAAAAGTVVSGSSFWDYCASSGFSCTTGASFPDGLYLRFSTTNCGVQGWHLLPPFTGDSWVGYGIECGGSPAFTELHDAYHYAGPANDGGFTGTLQGPGTWFFGGSYARYLSLPAAQRAGATLPIGSSDFAALPSGTGKIDLSGSFTQGSAISDAELESALDAINSNDEGSQDAADAAAVEQLREEAGLDVAVVPNCLGLTETECNSALDTVGFTEVPDYVTADFSGADVTKPAETVVEQPVSAGVEKPLGWVWDDFTLNPAEEEMPMGIPRPLHGETYSDYVTRLQGLGYLGTVTYIDLTDITGEPDYGPDAVPRVGLKIGTSTTTVIKLGSSWPSPNPLIKRGSDIVVYRNPPTFPPVEEEEVPEDPSESPPYPGDAPDGTGIDFSPLTDLDPGCSFPYGFLCYAQEVTGWFDVTPEAPRFTFGIHDVTVAGNTYSVGSDYDVDLDVMSAYMAILRGIFSVCIWVGGVYILATRLLGFQAGGDPGEAIDEGLPLS